MLVRNIAKLWNGATGAKGSKFALAQALHRIALLGLMAFAAPLSAAAQDGVLTVVVTKEAGATPVTTEYDLAAMQALPKTSFETTTQWTEGVQVFEGVATKDLLTALAVTGGTMIATALDGYLMEIPVADMLKAGPMIAYSMNGAPLPAGDKGPYWLVYPYDSAPEFNTEDTISRSIWQLQQLEFTP